MTRLTLTMEEAAEALSVSRATLYRMRRDGQITIAKLRAKSVISIEEIHRVLRLTQPPVAGPVAEPKKLKLKKRKLYPHVSA